jgi:hypothetical protein
MSSSIAGTTNAVVDCDRSAARRNPAGVKYRGSYAYKQPPKRGKKSSWHVMVVTKYLDVTMSAFSAFQDGKICDIARKFARKFEHVRMTLL